MQEVQLWVPQARQNADGTFLLLDGLADPWAGPGLVHIDSQALAIALRPVVGLHRQVLRNSDPMARMIV